MWFAVELESDLFFEAWNARSSEPLQSGSSSSRWARRVVLIDGCALQERREHIDLGDRLPQAGGSSTGLIAAGDDFG